MLRRFPVLAAAWLLGSPALAAFVAPGPTCLANGPCQQPDTIDLIMRAPRLVPVVNFGLLLPGAAGAWEFVCEEQFRGRYLDRVHLDDRGRVMIATVSGLAVSDDGCAWSRPAGPVGSGAVWDVALDPAGRMFVLGGDRRVLYLSEDGGVTFTARHTFAEGLRLLRVVLAPSDPRTVYVAGYRGDDPLILGVSRDGGETFDIDMAASEPLRAEASTVEFLGVAPDDPQTVYLAIGNPRGDQLWRSTDRGRAPVKILTLMDDAQLTGFAFGATPRILYVAGTDALELPRRPPARLYVSRDGGKEWENRPSPAEGPRYRCLRFSEGKLHACAGDSAAGDRFLVGSSDDEGATWSPMVRLADLKGARACAAATCATTAEWLCAGLGICGGVSGRDAGVAPDGGAATDEGGGCGCTVGAAGRATAVWWAVAVAALVFARRRRR